MATENLTVKVGADIGNFEKKMSAMQGRMNKIGGKFSSIGASFTKGSAAIVGGVAAAGAGLYGLTSKVTENADAIAKGSERMGISTKAYQEMDFWASQNGISQEQMEKGVRRLNQRLGDAINGNEKYAGALEKLDVNLDGVREGTVSTEDAMTQSIQSLSQMENENEKAALAAELFGTKLAGDLMPALNDGALSMEESKKMAEELGIVMSDDQLKAAEEFQDAQDQIKRSLGAVAMQIGLDLMPHFQRMHEWILANLPQIRSTISGAFESVIDTVKSVIDWWQGLSDRMQTIIPVVAGVALAFGPVMLVIGKVINIVSGLIRIFAPMMAAITKAGGLLKWLAPLFTKIGSVIAVLTGPIGLTVAAIAALGAGFVLAYNKSETFRNFIDGLKGKFMGAWESAMEFKDKVITAFNAIFAIFKGDEGGGINMLESLGLTEDQISMITGAIDSIKERFNTMKTAISNVLSTVKSFFIEQFQGIKSWWDADGAMILSAMSTQFDRVFNSIKTVVDVALKFVISLFQTFAPIVQGIWNTVWPIIVTIAKNAWETIKFTIGTAMDLIQGVISAVSAIIEGDWSRFGEILKETALSIKDRVVTLFTNLKDNAIQLFDILTGGAVTKFIEMKDNAIAKVIEMKDSVVNKFTELKDGAINRITGAYNSVTSKFDSMRSFVSDKARNLKTAVTDRFTELKDNSINRITGAYNSVTRKFESLKSSVSTKAQNLRQSVTDRFTELKDNSIGRVSDAYDGVTGWFGDMSTSVSDTAQGIKDDTVGKFTDMKDGAIDGAEAMWSGVTDFFSDIWDDATSLFDDMVDGAKELPSRIGDAISGAASAAVDGVKSLGNDMAGGLRTVVDGVTDGLNGILDKIGVGGGDLIDPIKIPGFSTGTSNGKLTSDTLGVLNDKGPGNGRGGATQELIERNGSLLAPKGKDALVSLQKGDKIHNGAETQSLMASGLLPRFSQGTGSEGGDSGSKGLLGTLGDVLKNAWSYISDPGKAFDAVMDSVTPDFSGLEGFGGKMAKGGFGMIKDNALDWLTGIFKDNEGALGSGQSGSFMGYPMTTPYSPLSPVPGYPTSFNGGRHYGIDYGTPIGTPVEAPMGGQLSSFWNAGGGKVAKLVTGQLRQFFMHMQTVGKSGSVQAGDVIGKTGNSGKWTTGPHVHWQAQQGTDSLNTGTVDPTSVVGHANGGIFRNNHIAEINEEGPEAIIPLSAKRRGRAKSLHDSVGKAIGSDDGSKETINLLTEQNRLLKKIYDKKSDIHMDSERVGSMMDERDAVNAALRF